MVTGVGYNHAEESIHRLEWRQAKIGIQANDFRYDVANLGQQFAAYVLDFVGAQAADFFDDGQRQREVG